MTTASTSLGGAAGKIAAAARKQSSIRESRFSFLVSRWVARRVNRNEKRETRNEKRKFLLISQRYHGIYSDRPQRWNQAGRESYYQDEQRRDGERQWISRIHGEEQIRNNARDPEC